MPTLRNTFKRIVAALMFFTRLPLWRIVKVEREYFEGLVPLWPLAGWLTGGVMALVAWGALETGLPAGMAVVLAMTARVVLTGALHEDGFADFCDGFGGGGDRQSVLKIMKDSHIGTYGVLGLALYALVFFNSLTSLLEAGWSPLVFVIADSLSKWISSTMVYFLPYARSESEAKNKLVYATTPLAERVASLVLGVLPLLLFSVFAPDSVPGARIFLQALLLPMAGAGVLFLLMHRRIGGYTGDCCGATFIVTEILFYLSLCVALF